MMNERELPLSPRRAGIQPRRFLRARSCNASGGDSPSTTARCSRPLGRAMHCAQGGSMDRKWMIAALAAASVVGAAAPAVAQQWDGRWSGYRSWDEPSVSVGVSVGPAYRGWGYDSYSTDAYAADWDDAPRYGYVDQDEPRVIGVRDGGAYAGYAAAGTRRYWAGREYCWYDDGWRGSGWYRCGFQLRVGYGWGGPHGWHGWGGGYRGEFREGSYYRGGVVREGTRERGAVAGEASETVSAVRADLTVRARGETGG